ncbi:hypothetical protein Amal_02256 [Acetobacter malorum]|uniref:Transporter n=1 Tax=Acetobacter malorum TaxID=178901 RepID=A0A177G867_9PROT|nr:hypothetical protein [Acetobacter malorum]OAG76482.1 hypothetical protein Amal_02256 [Acetobacter malorum]
MVRLSFSLCSRSLYAVLVGSSLVSLSSHTAHAAQWYTGSLVSPSGAKSHAGDLGVEPYYTYSQPVGTFASNGTSHPLHPRQQTFSNSTLWKYGITDDISIQTHTVVSYGWKHTAGHAHGPQFGDFPVDLIWRFLHPNPKRFIPDLNLFAGVVMPTGAYSRLRSTQDGTGTGAYVFRVAVTSQSTYTLPGNHALRLRVWNWWRHALTSARLHDTTTYGTTQGFHGTGRPGMSGQTGFSLEYGINQRWVLAMDLARDWANGSHLKGWTAAGTRVNKISAASTDWQIAPAVEYNWNPRWGVIAGAAVYYAGHNTGIKVAPQFAVNAVF